MSKFKFLVLLSLSSVILSACNNGESGKNSDSSAVTQTDSSASHSEKSKPDVGKINEIDTYDELNISQTSGPVTLSITKIERSQIEPREEYQDILGGKKLGALTFNVTVENSSQDTLSIYPDQGTVTTGSGEQIDASPLFSDEVGGEIGSGQEKKGIILFTFDGDPAKINKLSFVVEGAHNESFETVGKKIIIPFSFKN